MLHAKVYFLLTCPWNFISLDISSWRKVKNYTNRNVFFIITIGTYREYLKFEIHLLLMVTILCWYLKFLVSQYFFFFCFCEAQRIFSKHVCQRTYYLIFIKFSWHALNMGINTGDIGSDNPMLYYIKNN